MSSTSLFPEIIRWLEKRRVPVPAALHASRRHAANGRAGSPSEVAKEVLAMLPALRERERRALTRFIEQFDKKQREASAPPPKVDTDEDDDGDGRTVLPTVVGGEWPASVSFTNDYAWGKDVPESERLTFQPAAWRRRASKPSQRAHGRVVQDPDHPAFGQHGLFASRRLEPGVRVIDYVGAVCLGANEDKTSDYVCDFGEASQFALDARHAGNEARFINDYRNTGRHANVEFRLRRDTRGEMRQGVFVCAKAAVEAGEELLISYGQGYWRSRVGDLGEFIHRRPGEPVGGRAAAESSGGPHQSRTHD